MIFYVEKDHLRACSRTARGQGYGYRYGSISMPELAKLLKDNPTMRRELLALLLREEVKCERNAKSA